MKHKIGDVVRKKINAGFIGEALTCVIPDLPENHEEPELCCLCDDPDCVCWPTLYVVNAYGAEIGMACHVSDCEMEEDN